MPWDAPTETVQDSGTFLPHPGFMISFRLQLVAALLSAMALAPPASHAAEPAAAGGTAPMNIPHVAGKAKIDGVLDEPVWQQAHQFELVYESKPGDNTPAGVKTTVYIGENGEHLLVAFVAEDPDPKQIRAFLRDRDSAYNDDFVGMNLDTFDDQRRAYEFYVNPYGAQMDLIYNGNNGEEDASWDGLWDAVGKITATGYIVEIEIPFSTLRFQKSKDIQQWGADFVRFRPRSQRYRFSNNKLKRNDPCYLCNVGKLRGFGGIHPGSNLEIAPTVTVSYNQQRPDAVVPFQSEGIKVDGGLDVKWGPSPNMTLNATINPDFSQVEADSAQLDINNTFALFFEEKRPFFLEGKDYFNTPNTIVYTRNVNDPDAGLRVTGQSGNQTYGVFVAHDRLTDLLLPGVFGSRLVRYDGVSNDAAFRYRYDFPGNSSLGGNASLGAIATVRNGYDYRNVVEGVDGRWQKGAHTVIAQWLHSSTQDPGEASSSGGDAHTFEYNYDSRNWRVYAGQNQFDDGFRADLGFIGQVGFKQEFAGVNRLWYGDADASITQMRLSLRWSLSRDTAGQVLNHFHGIQGSMNGPLLSYAEAGHDQFDRYWNGVVFHESINRMYANFTPISGLTLGLFVRHGDKVDFANTRLATVTTIEPEITANIGKSLSIQLDHNYERLSRDGGDVYVANLTDLRISYQFSLRQRLRVALLRGDVQRDPALYGFPVRERSLSVNSQLIYSYKVNPRTALYAGYADGYFGDQLNPLFQTDRTLFIKIGYASEH
jgi:hypothetical protein